MAAVSLVLFLPEPEESEAFYPAPSEAWKHLTALRKHWGGGIIPRLHCRTPECEGQESLKIIIKRKEEKKSPHAEPQEVCGRFPSRLKNGSREPARRAVLLYYYFQLVCVVLFH